MLETAASVLIIEDEPQIGRFIKAALESQSFKVWIAGNGLTGLAMAEEHKPELVILDLGLPDMDGVEVVRRLRTWTQVPIIALTARALEASKVATLDAGADDYLTKPFSVAELLARARAALRRAAVAQTDAQGEFKLGELKADLIHRQVFIGEREVHLTPIEFRLLSVLIQHAGRVMTYKQLLSEVWGPSHGEDNHYVRIYMGQLRHKLEQDPAQPRFLLTEAGVGYRLADS